jgi:DNA-directed RNA polymerase specialized sigma24 family protein
VDAVLDRLERALEADEPPSDPSWWPGYDGELSVTDTPPVPPRSLHRRLTTEQRAAIVNAFNHGTPQKELAASYGISVRSVRRLIHVARQIP